MDEEKLWIIGKFLEDSYLLYVAFIRREFNYQRYFEDE